MSIIGITEKVYSMLKQDYNILLLSPFGSWNYGLAKEGTSDYDYIAVILPNKYDLINRTVINKTVEHNFGTGGKIDLKDIYTFFKSIEGLNYLETLIGFSYKIGKNLNSLHELEVFLRNEYIKTNKYPVAKRIEAQLINNAKKVLKILENKDFNEQKLRKLITECMRLDNMLINFLNTGELKFKLDPKYAKKLMEIRYENTGYKEYLLNIFNIVKFGSIIPDNLKDYVKDYEWKFRQFRNNIILDADIC